MSRAVSVLFLLVAPSLSTPLNSWEGSKDWEDQNSWRSVKNWEDDLDWNNQKSVKDQKGWGDDAGLGNKNWDSFSDRIFSPETHNWNRKRRSLEYTEYAEAVIEALQRYDQGRANKEETFEVMRQADFRWKQKVANKKCQTMLALHEVKRRLYSRSPELSAAIAYNWVCNEFCCYPERKTATSS